MAIINDALWSEVFITYEDGDTETFLLILKLKLKKYISDNPSLNLGLDMWTYKNGENVKLTNFNI
jgi:hypothetical protein